MNNTTTTQSFIYFFTQGYYKRFEFNGAMSNALDLFQNKQLGSFIVATTNVLDNVVKKGDARIYNICTEKYEEAN